MTAPRQRPLAIRIAHLPAYLRLAVSVGVALVVLIALPTGFPWRVRMVASWDSFALTALMLIWVTILKLEPSHIRRVAQIEDPSRTVSLALVILGASASLLSVVVLLQSSAKMGDVLKIAAIVLALSAVMLAWFLIHTVFTLRYAHIFYATPGKPGGLQFPENDDCPVYLDFAYFAFVIGMTAQTSDVVVVHREMRRNVLLHGLISFGFNTAVVALSIGVLTSLL
jgi:uncharacterized membrane protein